MADPSAPPAPSMPRSSLAAQPRALAQQDWERTTALLMHASLLTWHVLLPIVPALGLWLWRRKRSAFLDDHGREALNFQVSLLIYAGVVALLGSATCGVAWYIGLPALYLFAIVAMILACARARKGLTHRYPATLRLIHPAL